MVGVLFIAAVAEETGDQKDDQALGEGTTEVSLTQETWIETEEEDLLQWIREDMQEQQSEGWNERSGEPEDSSGEACDFSTLPLDSLDKDVNINNNINHEMTFLEHDDTESPGEPNDQLTDVCTDEPEGKLIDVPLEETLADELLLTDPEKENSLEPKATDHLGELLIKVSLLDGGKGTPSDPWVLTEGQHGVLRFRFSASPTLCFATGTLHYTLPNNLVPDSDEGIVEGTTSTDHGQVSYEIREQRFLTLEWKDKEPLHEIELYVQGTWHGNEERVSFGNGIVKIVTAGEPDGAGSVQTDEADRPDKQIDGVLDEDQSDSDDTLQVGTDELNTDETEDNTANAQEGDLSEDADGFEKDMQTEKTQSIFTDPDSGNDGTLEEEAELYLDPSGEGNTGDATETLQQVDSMEKALDVLQENLWPGESDESKSSADEPVLSLNELLYGPEFGGYEQVDEQIEPVEAAGSGASTEDTEETGVPSDEGTDPEAAAGEAGDDDIDWILSVDLITSDEPEQTAAQEGSVSCICSDGTKVTVSGPLPAEAQLHVSPASIHVPGQEVLMAMDIVITDGHGTVYTPTSGVLKVTIDGDVLAQARQDPSRLHVYCESGEAGEFAPVSDVLLQDEVLTFRLLP